MSRLHAHSWELGRLPRYTTLDVPCCVAFPLQAGMFPDVAERLALAHLAKGDQMSALITGGGCWLVLFFQPNRHASSCWIGQSCSSLAMRSITKLLATFILRASLPLLPTPLALGAAACAAARLPVVRPCGCSPNRPPHTGAGEWYMRNSHFPGWGRPYEFNSQLMARVGRAEEARDVVRTGSCWLDR